MELVWLTDIHLNFLHRGGSAIFGKYVRQEHPRADALVVSGDIGEYHNFAPLIEEFAGGFNGPVWFITGNHDSYRGSISGMKTISAECSGKARWLQSQGMVELSSSAVLVGHDGWYDASFGDPYGSNVVMSDFSQIKELRLAGMSAHWQNRNVNPLTPVVAALQELGRVAAEESELLLKSALDKGYKQVVFATHVPPFIQATWHLGKHSEPNWLPWMSSEQMGVMLRKMARNHSDVEFTVLCGHTHSSGTFQAEPNLKVLTGKSEYGHPQVSGVFHYE